MAYDAELAIPTDILAASQRHLRKLVDNADEAIAVISSLAVVLRNRPSKRFFEEAGKLATDIIVGVAAVRAARLRGATASDYLPPVVTSEHAAELRMITSFDAIGCVPYDVASSVGVEQIHAVEPAMYALSNIVYMGLRLHMHWNYMSATTLDRMSADATKIIVAVAHMRIVDSGAAAIR